MKTRVLPLFTIGLLFVSLATVPPDAGAQVTGAPRLQPVTQPTTFYVQREQTAPPAIKTQLAQIRQTIQANNLPYTVGYTTALDRPLSELAGVVPPPQAEIVKQRTTFAQVQATLLQTDESLKIAYMKAHPTTIIPQPAPPPFTTASARADWRTAGKVPPIRNQGGCGSCWAFAVMGAYESSYLIRNNTMPDTSEQAMLSCSGPGSCAGGWPHDALNWLVASGTDKEADYPYTGTSGGCHGFTPEFKAAAWGWVDNNVDLPTVAQLKQALFTYGPIEVLVWVSGQFQAYTGGVFTQAAPNPGALNHAVVLVGWDDAKGAWIMRNSWGTGWGETCGYGTERGYMYIKYGAANIGLQAQWVRAPSPTIGTSSKLQEILKQRLIPLQVAPATNVAPLTR
jgi:cathepsin L